VEEILAERVLKLGQKSFGSFFKTRPAGVSSMEIYSIKKAT